MSRLDYSKYENDLRTNISIKDGDTITLTYTDWCDSTFESKYTGQEEAQITCTVSNIDGKDVENTFHNIRGSLIWKMIPVLKEAEEDGTLTVKITRTGEAKETRYTILVL